MEVTLSDHVERESGDKPQRDTSRVHVLYHESQSSARPPPVRHVATTTKKANDDAAAAAGTASQRLAKYREKTTGITEFERDHVIPALAFRSYHLPGNDSCWSDWRQYIANNHPVFGIFCHHRLHPISVRMRIINLFGSIVFGLAVTNSIWLFMIYRGRDPNQVVLTVSFGGNDNLGVATNFTASQQLAVGGDDRGGGSVASANHHVTTNTNQLELTEGMLLLWTIGTSLHALFDNTVWYLSVCICCLPFQTLESLHVYRTCGTYTVALLVVAFAAVATLVVLLRAAVDGSEHEVDLEGAITSGLADDEIPLDVVRDASAWEFLISYAIELALALFVYYQIVASLLFSGILGCGRLPVLGGRPYEVERQARRDEEEGR